MITPIIFRILQKEKFDLIHEFSSTPLILIRSFILRIFFGVPTIFTHSVFNKTVLGKNFWFKIFDFASIYILQAEEQVKKLSNLGVKEDKIKLIYPFIEKNRFTKKIDKKIARTKLFLPQDRIIYCYFGSLTKEKGVLDLVNAINLLDKTILSNSLFVFFIVWKGSTEHDEILSKLKNQSILVREEYVDIPTLIAASDVVVLPQRTGTGATIPQISLLEAILMGKRFICTDIIGNKEWIDNANGVLVPPKDPFQLKKAIEFLFLRSSTQLVNNKDLIASLNPRGILERYLDTYKKSAEFYSYKF